MAVLTAAQFPAGSFGFFFFLMIRPPPRPTLFPCTPPFRSMRDCSARRRAESRRQLRLPRLLLGYRRRRPQPRRRRPHRTRLNPAHRTTSYALLWFQNKHRPNAARTPPPSLAAGASTERPTT